MLTRAVCANVYDCTPGEYTRRGNSNQVPGNSNHVPENFLRQTNKTQAYNRIPLMVRKVATGLIAFKLKNVKEIQSIFDEYVVGLTKEQFITILKFVYKTPFDFLYINMDESWDDMYYRNFNKFILGGV